MQGIFSRFKALVNRVFTNSLGSITRDIVRSIKNDEPFDVQLIFSKVDASVNIMNSAIINMSNVDDETLKKVALNNTNRFRSYKQIIGQSGTDYQFLDASNKALIRKLSNREFDRILLRGGGIKEMREALTRKITERMIDIDNPKIIAEKFYDAVKVFNRDGQPRIAFINKNGKRYSFTPEHYANILSESIFNESNWSTAIKEALKKGTGLIKFNKTGTSKSSYIKQQDPICAAIDGSIFSVHPNGSTDKNGKFHQSIFDVIKSKLWLRPHPFCEHKPSVYEAT